MLFLVVYSEIIGFLTDSSLQINKFSIIKYILVPLFVFFDIISRVPSFFYTKPSTILADIFKPKPKLFLILDLCKLLPIEVVNTFLKFYNYSEPIPIPVSLTYNLIKGYSVNFNENTILPPYGVNLQELFNKLIKTYIILYLSDLILPIFFSSNLIYKSILLELH